MTHQDKARAVAVAITVALASPAAAQGCAPWVEVEAYPPAFFVEAYTNSRMEGTDKADFIQAGGEDDWLYTLGGDDTVLAGDGSDTIFLGAGADLVFGAGGNDALYGEADADTLLGGPGNDTLTGGPGADLFVFGGGHDTIADFGKGDRIALLRRLVEAFDCPADFLAARAAGSASAWLDLGSAGSLLLVQAKAAPPEAFVVLVGP
jgi:Ca2+-binding RTX toxin-like protein